MKTNSEDILELRKRDYKKFKGSRNDENEPYKDKNWYHLQEFDECCSKCKHAQETWDLPIAEKFRCKHCGVVDWNGWCKIFIMNPNEVKP